jgi:hypothetical protein
LGYLIPILALAIFGIILYGVGAILYLVVTQTATSKQIGDDSKKNHNISIHEQDNKNEPNGTGRAQ